MAQIVYTDVAEGSGLHGSLFPGTKFWFSHSVPSRSHFIEQVKVGELFAVCGVCKLNTALSM